jgi:hypothetical protein
MQHQSRGLFQAGTSYYKAQLHMQITPTFRSIIQDIDNRI